MRIGDVFRAGSALLQVSQPRVPCFKLAMRMRDHAFGKPFLASGRVGFYLRVLEEGEVQDGDPIELVSAGEGAVSVRRVAWLLVDATRRTWTRRPPSPTSPSGGACASPSGRSRCAAGPPRRPSGVVAPPAREHLGVPVVVARGAEGDDLGPVGTALQAAPRGRRHPDGVERPQLHGVVLDAQPRRARERQVDLLLGLVAVAERRPEAGREAEVADPRALEAERPAREARLEPGERSNRGAMSSTSSRRLSFVYALIAPPVRGSHGAFVAHASHANCDRRLVANVQIRGVPDDVHRRLKSQAALEGQSLNEFLLARMTDIARTPTIAELAERVRARGAYTGPSAATAVREDRGP